MRNYSNSIVVKFTTTDSGTSGAGKLVTVFDAGTTNKADLFDMTLSPINNPVQADDSGNYSFTINDGTYDLYIDYLLPTQTSILKEQISNIVNNPPLSPGDNVIAFDELSDAVNDSNPLKIFNGAALNIKERTTGEGGGAMWDVVLASTVSPNTFNIVQCVGVPTLALVVRVGVKIDVTLFGAVGDWSTTNQTGANDTLPVQAAIDYMTTIPNVRLGGKRSLLFPAGQYRLDSLLFPVGLDFGVDVVGEGSKGSTTLWFDQNIVGTPAISIEVEFTSFKDMKIHGSLLHTANEGDRRDILIQGRLPTARADIDISFDDCILGAAHVGVRCVGRGFKMTGGGVFGINDVLEIHCDPLNIPPGGNPRIIMRHYVFNNIRVDAATNLITVTGTGVQKGFILDTIIADCDFFNLDKLIDAPIATFRGLTITGCAGLENYENGFIECQDLIGFSITGGIYQKLKDVNTTITSTADTITNFILCSGSVINGTITGLIIGQLEKAMIKANEINYVTINNIVLPDLWVYDGGVTSSVLVDSDFLLDPTITITNVTGSGVGGKAGSRVVDDNMNPAGIIMHSNDFDSPNVRDYWTYIPQFMVSGSPSATVPTVSLAKYTRVGDYIEVQYSFLISNPAETGSLGLSLPAEPAPIPESGITGTYAGSGDIGKGSGWPATITSNVTISVNTMNDVAEFVHSTGGLTANVSIVAPIPSFVAQGFFKYRFK